MDLSFGMVNRIEDKRHYLHFWLWKRSGTFYLQKNIPWSKRYYFREVHRRCCCDDLLGQNILDHLRSWGAGLKPFRLSLILLQCHGDAGGILHGHYSRVEFINLGDKIVHENSFWLVTCVQLLNARWLCASLLVDILRKINIILHHSIWRDLL